MTTAVDGKSFSGLSTNSSQFGLKGGYYVVAAIGTITTSVELQMLGPDGSTFVSLPTALKVTASGGTVGGYAPPGQISIHADQRDWRLVLCHRSADFVNLGARKDTPESKCLSMTAPCQGIRPRSNSKRPHRWIRREKGGGPREDTADELTAIAVEDCNAARGQLPGTTTNDSASAGNIGETISQTILLGSAVSLTSGTAANIATITLTAGDWDIEAQAAFDGGATTTVSGLRSSISTTSATENTASPNFAAGFYNGGTVFNTFDVTLTIARIRVSLSGSQQYWLVSRAQFGTSTCTGCYGTLKARRMR